MLKLSSKQALISFQDLGRKSQRHTGATVSGVADEYAYLTAQKLLNNQPNLAVLELTFGPAEFEVVTDCQIAITGASSELTINNQPATMWQVLNLFQGDRLALSPPRQGIYMYLAIKGGFKAKKYLTSASQTNTSLVTQGDVFVANDNDGATKLPPNNIVKYNYRQFYQSDNFAARFIPSPLWHQLSRAEQNALTASAFTVDVQSNKMAYRLTPEKSIALASSTVETSVATHTRKLSMPVTFGTIQLPNTDEWLVLMKEHQTIGGYPSIGTVISVDLFRLAQMRPLEKIHFVPTKVEQGQAQLQAFYQRFTS